MSEDPIVALKGQVEALEGWRKQMLAVQSAADDRLRPLLEGLPGSLGRHAYEVAADEIERLRGQVEALHSTIVSAIELDDGGCDVEALDLLRGALTPAERAAARQVTT